MRAILAVTVLVGFAAAGLQTFPLRFRDGSASIALPASAAETTNWQICERGRVQSLEWQLWVNVGATDSARVKIDRQFALRDTLFPVTAKDTIVSVSVCNVAETTGAPRVLSRQFWPIPCWRERFIVTGISGNSNVAHVGNLVLQTDDLQ